MDLVLKVGQACVFDNVLSEQEFLQVWTLMDRMPYERSDAVLWHKAWSISDGAILRGPQWVARDPDWTLVPPDRAKGLKPFPKDPPPLVSLLEKVRDAFDSQPDLPGVYGISMSPYVWPPGSSIAWHSDGASIEKHRTGACTFYAHKYWNCEWGGEFLVTDIDPHAEGISAAPSFDNRMLSARIMSLGHGVWVAPKPNRLIINPANTLHKVSKSTMDSAPRLSVQCFLFEE